MTRMMTWINAHKNGTHLQVSFRRSAEMPTQFAQKFEANAGTIYLCAESGRLLFHNVRS